MNKMRFLVIAAGLAAISLFAFADTSHCACDIANPETMAARECGLCKEAEKQPADAPVFFLKDNNPRKPNRWLVLPRIHGKGGDAFAEMTPAQRTDLWTAAVAKGKEIWGDQWGLAYNGD